jgi:adenosylhomocysteine nucleosidase
MAQRNEALRNEAQTIVLIAPMPNELRPIVKRLGLRQSGEQGGLPVYRGSAGGVDVLATRTGIGPRLAAETTERVLALASVDRVVVSGIAGGIDPVTAVGDLVVPEEVVDGATGERYRATPPEGVAVKGLIRTGGPDDYSLTPDEIGRLRDSGVIALDMETAAIARVCEGNGVPWVAFRAISDMAGDETLGPVVMTLVKPDGTPKLGASLRFLLTHPRRIPRMMRLAREANAAAVTAARAAVASVRG